MFDGQDATHLPPEASWLLAQVRQNVDDPAQVPQDESHAVKRGHQTCLETRANVRLTGTSNIVLGVEERPSGASFNAFALGKHEAGQTTGALHLVDRRRDIEAGVFAARALGRTSYEKQRQRPKVSARA